MKAVTNCLSPVRDLKGAKIRFKGSKCDNVTLTSLLLAQRGNSIKRECASFFGNSKEVSPTITSRFSRLRTRSFFNKLIGKRNFEQVKRYNMLSLTSSVTQGKAEIQNPLPRSKLIPLTLTNRLSVGNSDITEWKELEEVHSKFVTTAHNFTELITEADLTFSTNSY